MLPATFRWFFPVPACILLQTSFGAFYASGVFASREASLTYALGLASATLSVALTGAGLALHHRAHTSSARTLALVGAVLLGTQALLPLALEKQNIAGLHAAAGLLGVGYGFLYVVSIMCAQAWVPEKPGTATGAVVFAGGVGTVAYVGINAVLAEKLRSTHKAMTVAAAIQCFVALFAASFISMPPSVTWHPDDDHNLCNGDDGVSAPHLGRDSDEAQPLLGKQRPPHPQLPSVAKSNTWDAVGAMSAREMLLDRSFILLVVTVLASVGPGFGVVLHGARMQSVMFGVPHAVADRRFFLITVAGVSGRLVTGIVLDLYAAARVRSSSLPHSMAAFYGGKVVNAALLTLQVAALLVMIPSARYGYERPFAVAIACVYLTFSGTAVVSPCLCRSTFSPANATLAFSLVGLAIGAGDALFSLLVASCADRGTIAGSNLTHQYDLFVFFSLAASIVGLFASVFLQPRLSKRTGSSVVTVRPSASLIEGQIFQQHLAQSQHPTNVEYYSGTPCSGGQSV
jgi:MFS family permease